MEVVHNTLFLTNPKITEKIAMNKITTKIIVLSCWLYFVVLPLSFFIWHVAMKDVYQHEKEELNMLFLSIGVLIAMGWFWHRAVFSEQTKYLILVVILCFPLIFLWGWVAGGVFSPLGFATIILKRDKFRTSENRQFHYYLYFLFTMLFLTLLCGLII